MRARWASIILLLIILLVAVFFPVAVMAAEEALGTTRTSCTSGDTYTIGSQEELAYLAALVNNGNVGAGVTFKLTSNITVTNDYNPTGDGNWTSIGYGYDFAGTFDGQGFTVSGITVPSNDNMGLFSSLGSASRVMNLRVSSALYGNINVGGIAAVNHGIIENCTNTGNIGGNQSVGGIVGENNNLVIGCTNTGAITANYNAGGIAGYSATYSTIQNCVNNGNVRSNGNDAGGITPEMLGVVRNCYNTGTVTGKDYTGGIAGFSYGKIYNCYNTGDIVKLKFESIYAGAVVGGFIESAPYSRPVVDNCFWLDTGMPGLGSGDCSHPNMSSFTPENNGTLQGPINGDASLLNVLNSRTIPGDKKWAIGTGAYTYPMMIAVAPSVTNPDDASVNAGSKTSFTATASGYPAPTCQWQVSTNGTTWNNVTDGTGMAEETYTTPAAVYSMNGWRYRCVFTNIAGEIASNPATLTVNRLASSVITLPTASAIDYGDTLSESTLTGGSGNVAGSFVWTDGTISPTVADSGTTQYAVTFLPNDSEHYAASTAQVTLAVNKATPLVISAPTASAITYGQTLSQSALSGGVTNTPGSFAWTNGSTAPDVTDSNLTGYPVTFTPDDDDNYTTAAAAVKLTVNKAPTTVMTLPGTSAITYGQTLSASVLTGGSGSVPGSFAWTNGTTVPTVADSGTTAYSVTFIPTDSVRYANSTATVTLVINKASTTVDTLPVASAITYGQTLSASSFTGGSGGVPGSFAWTDGTTAPSVSDSGLTAYPIIFTPTDTHNYYPSSAAVTLVVDKATPVIIESPAAEPITYGHKLSDSVLSGGSASVPGSFAWTEGDAIPWVTNTPYRSVTFTPTDTINYTTSTATAYIITNKADFQLVTAPVAASITYGQSLADSVLSGGEVHEKIDIYDLYVGGAFSWTNGLIKPDISDSNITQYSVYFTSNYPSYYNENFNALTAAVTLTVNKATPTITTLPVAADITYGEPLSDSVLSGGLASVPGTFAWTDAAAKPAVSDSGVTMYSVTFTPTDTAHYNTVTTSLALTVNKAVCDMSGVVFADARFAYDGNPKSLSIGTLPASVSVSYTGNGMTDVGVYTVTASFTSENYAPIPDMTARLTISPSGIPENYTMAIGSRVIWEPLPEGGTWEWDHTCFNASFDGAAAFTALKTGESVITYTVNGITQRTTVSVTKATYDMRGITFADARYAYDGNPKSLLIAGTLPPGVSVSYAGNERAEAGVYTVTASFTADSENYLPIPDMTAKLTIYPSGIPETYTMFVGGRAVWEPQPQGGTWAWDPAFFNATFNSPAAFTALKAGESVISYKVNGAVQNITVTIKKSELPGTGQDVTWIWVLMGMAVVCGVGAVLIVIRKRAKLKARENIRNL